MKWNGEQQNDQAFVLAQLDMGHAATMLYTLLAFACVRRQAVI